MFKKSALAGVALAGVALLFAAPAAALAEELPSPPAVEEAAAPAPDPSSGPAEEPTAEEPAAPIVEAPAPSYPPTVEEPVVLEPVAQSKTLRWVLPDGGTPENVTWPQPVFDAALIPCGTTVWVQVDTYPYTTPYDQARTDALAADGLLLYGEDHGWAASWTFEQYTAPACVLPPNPRAELSSSCSVATVNLANPQEPGTIVQTAAFVVQVDGEFYGSYSVEGMGGYPVQVTFDEDSGDHVVAVYQAGISEWALLGSVNVPSDCVAPPVEPETPVVPETPTTPLVPAAIVTPVTAPALAETGADPSALWTLGALAAALLTAGGIAITRRKA